MDYAAPDEDEDHTAVLAEINLQMSDTDTTLSSCYQVSFFPIDDGFTPLSRADVGNGESAPGSSVPPSSQLTMSLKSPDEPMRHSRFHARHRFEAIVGTREIGNLREFERSAITSRRGEYERGLRDFIEKGAAEGRLTVYSPRLPSYAILDMGMGVGVCFREDGPLHEDALAREYGTIALRVVDAS
jgi:hypothetical protein